ncbi:MAG: DUF2824 family protein [Deltaproteobacteria bacterium]|nr:DUF2824 family protein [Deltaproteobacteria bacterium]
MRCTVKDFGKVYRVLTHKSVYPYIIDDYCPKEPPSDFGMVYLKNDNVYVLMPNNDCVFLVFPITHTVHNVHSGMLPNIRGKMGIKYAKQAIAWTFNNTDCRVMIGFTPTQNKAAMMFNRLIGLKKITTLKKSHLHGGNLCDQGLFVLHKGDERWA